jgi:hypothetical protein
MGHKIVVDANRLECTFRLEAAKRRGGNMSKFNQPRGTIIKTPDSSPGLLVVDGQQKTFTLEGVWKSSAAPAVNMAVDIELDGAGLITGLTAVDPQQAAREKLERIGGAAVERSRQGVGALAVRMGRATLAAAALLWIAWFFTPALTLREDISNVSKSFTFWDLVGLDPNTNIVTTPASHGLFGLLGLLAIAAPFGSPFMRNPKARYLYAMPLGYLVIAVFVILSDFNTFFGHIYSSLADAMKVLSFSFGYGTYVLVITSLFLAARVLKRPAGGDVEIVVKPPTVRGPFLVDRFCIDCGKELSPGANLCAECRDGRQRSAAGI